MYGIDILILAGVFVVSFIGCIVIYDHFGRPKEDRVRIRKQLRPVLTAVLVSYLVATTIIMIIWRILR